MATRYQIIYWRDIPAQAKVKEGSKRASRPLSNRFLVAIDEAAMRAGKTDSNDYLDQWHNSGWKERDGELEEVAAALITELEAAYPPERLHAIIRQHGWDREEE